MSDVTDKYIEDFDLKSTKIVSGKKYIVDKKFTLNYAIYILKDKYLISANPLTKDEIRKTCVIGNGEEVGVIANLINSYLHNDKKYLYYTFDRDCIGSDIVIDTFSFENTAYSVKEIEVKVRIHNCLKEKVNFFFEEFEPLSSKETSLKSLSHTISLLNERVIDELNKKVGNYD